VSYGNGGYLLATAVVVALSVSWYVYSARTGGLRGFGKVPGVLILAFFFFTFGGVLLSVASLWRAHERDKVVTTWLQVDATVVTSRAFRPARRVWPTSYEWDSRAERWTDDSFGIETLWRYAAPTTGMAREGETRYCCTLNPDTSREQLRFFKAGSVHRVYLHPIDSATINLFDDGPIRHTGPRAAARSGYWLAAGGAVCLVLARVVNALMRNDRQTPSG
jgi:hypothetical protein